MKTQAPSCRQAITDARKHRAEIRQIQNRMLELSKVPGFVDALNGQSSDMAARDAVNAHFDLWRSLPACYR